MMNHQSNVFFKEASSSKKEVFNVSENNYVVIRSKEDFNDELEVRYISLCQGRSCCRSCDEEDIVVEESCITKYIVPDDVTHIEFGNRFNQPDLKPGYFPPSVRYFDIGFEFDQPILPNVIPHGTTHVSVGYKFYKQSLKNNVLPETVTHLRLDCNIDLSNVDIHKNIKHVTFGPSFNQKRLTPGCIPKTVTHVIFEFFLYKVLPPGVLQDEQYCLQYDGKYNKMCSIFPMFNTNA